MARRRGFFAEMQHQARVAEQRQRASDKQHQAALRRVEQAQRAEARALAAAGRAIEADRRQLEKEAAAAHVEAMQAETDALNAELAEKYSQLDGVLTMTLEVDDFVDLEELRVTVERLPFDRPGLKIPVERPAALPDPPLPVRPEVVAPAGVFNRKRKWAEAEALADQQYAAAYFAWKAASDALPGLRAQREAEYLAAEEARKQRLSEAEEGFAREQARREAEAREQNARLDALISGLAYGAVDAVEEYISIVLANSVYPEWFPVAHSSEFEPSTAELKLRVLIPGPDAVPVIKSYRYVKASDEIVTTPASQKDQKDRYARVVHSIALRSIHEVFEADRRKLIQFLALELGTETVNPATGRVAYMPFVALATQRTAFEEIDLAGVVPSATLEHLGAVVSKNPHGLVTADGAGVRKLL